MKEIGIEEFLRNLRNRVLSEIGDKDCKFLVFSELVDGYQATLIRYHRKGDSLIRNISYNEDIFDIIDDEWESSRSNPDKKKWGVLKYFYDAGKTDIEFLDEASVDIEASSWEKGGKLMKEYFPGLEVEKA